MPEFPNVDRIFLAESGRYVCDGCDAWVEMERWADARGREESLASDGRIMRTSIDRGRLDPPLQPTLYRCPRCGHDHIGPPSLKNPT
jgi:hypothetical protein